MARDKDIVFIRRGGRVIPIRKKKKPEKAKATAKAVASVAVLAGSAKVSAELVKKSRPSFVKSAQLRGASKLAQRGSKTYQQLIRKSAQAKIKGLTFQSRAGTILGLGTLASSIFAGSAIGDISKGSDISDEVAGFFSGAIPFLGALAFAKFGKVKFTGKTSGEIFGKIAKRGETQTRAIVKKFERTAFQAGRVSKGTQMEMKFSKTDLTKFLKGF